MKEGVSWGSLWLNWLEYVLLFISIEWSNFQLNFVNGYLLLLISPTLILNWHWVNVLIHKKGIENFLSTTSSLCILKATFILLEFVFSYCYRRCDCTVLFGHTPFWVAYIPVLGKGINYNRGLFSFHCIRGALICEFALIAKLSLLIFETLLWGRLLF